MKFIAEFSNISVLISIKCQFVAKALKMLSESLCVSGELVLLT